MKLADSVQDLFGLDPLVRGSGKDLADTSSKPSTQFEDVLSDLGSTAETDDLADQVVDKPITTVMATLRQADPGITGAWIVMPSVDCKVSNGPQSKQNAADRDRAPPPVGVGLSEIAIKAALAPTTSQSTPTRNLARSVDTLRSRDMAPDSVQLPGDLGIMISSKPSGPKPSPAQPAESNRRSLTVKEPYNFIATKLETTAAPPSQIDRDAAPKSIETVPTPEASARNDRQPESNELIAMLFGGLSNASIPFALAHSLDAGLKPIAAAAIEVPEETNVSSLPTPGGSPSREFKDPLIAIDPLSISAVEGLSVLSMSAHLAPSGNRAASPLNPKTRDTDMVSESSAGEADVEGARAVSSNPAAAPILDKQAPANAGRSDGQLDAQWSISDTPRDHAGRVSTNSESSIHSQAAADRTSRFAPSFHAVDVQGEASSDPSTGAGSAQLKHDARSDESAIHRTDPSQPTAATAQPAWPTQAAKPIAGIAAAVAKLAETAAASAPTSSIVSVAPARTLTLRLDQADLGPIDIRMHVSGTTLDLHLSVADHETLTILRRDREALTSAIADRQYQLHSLTIQDSSAAPTTATNNTNQGDAGGGTGARADTGAQASADQRGDRNNGHRESNAYRQGDKPAPSRSPVRDPRRGSLFV